MAFRSSSILPFRYSTAMLIHRSSFFVTRSTTLCGAPLTIISISISGQGSVVEKDKAGGINQGRLMRFTSPSFPTKPVSFPL
jgi:hypothetical protein